MTENVSVRAPRTTWERESSYYALVLTATLADLGIPQNSVFYFMSDSRLRAERWHLFRYRGKVIAGVAYPHDARRLRIEHPNYSLIVAYDQVEVLGLIQ